MVHSMPPQISGSLYLLSSSINCMLIFGISIKEIGYQMLLTKHLAHQTDTFPLTLAALPVECAEKIFSICLTIWLQVLSQELPARKLSTLVNQVLRLLFFNSFSAHTINSSAVAAICTSLLSP